MISLKKKSFKNALSRSEEKHRLIVEGISDGFFG